MSHDIIELLSSDDEGSPIKVFEILDDEAPRSRPAMELPSSPWRMNMDNSGSNDFREEASTDIIQIDDEKIEGDAMDDQIMILGASQVAKTDIASSDSSAIFSPIRPSRSIALGRTKRPSAGGKGLGKKFSVDHFLESSSDNASGIHALSKSLKARLEPQRKGHEPITEDNTMETPFATRLAAGENRPFSPHISSDSGKDTTSRRAKLAVGSSSSPLPAIPKVKDHTSKVQKSTSSSTSRPKDPMKAAYKELDKRLKNEKRLAEKKIQLANRRTVPRTERVQEITVMLNETMDKSSISKSLKDELSAQKISIGNSQKAPSVKIIHFQRQVTCEYKEEQDMFVPVPPRVEDENQVIVYTEAEELCKHLSSKNATDSHVNSLKSDLRNQTIIYLIEGLSKYIKKADDSFNRDVRNQVRQQLEKGSASGSAEQPSAFNSKKLYLRLSRMQVFHGVKIVHAEDVKEVHEWITNFAMDVACIPYNQVRLNLDDAFDNGYVKSGIDSKDNTRKSLENVKYVTAPSAEAIAEVYPTMYSLMRSINKRGVGALTGIKFKNTNRQLLNNSICSNMATLFTSRDPSGLLFSS